MIPRIVPKEDLLNAMALNTTAMNMLRVGGAGLAGGLMLVFSLGGVYLINGIIYIGVIIMTQLIRVPPGEARKSRGSLLADLGEGFAYMKKSRIVGGLVLLAMVLYVFGMPYQQVFVPVVVYEVFELNKAWVGLILSCTGIGALCGSLFVASRTEYRRPGLALAINLVVFGAALLVVAISRWLPLTLVAFAIAGSMTVSFITVTNTLLLTVTPQELQGRVMSLLSLDRGIIPAGALLAGSLVEVTGPRFAIATMAVLLLTLAGGAIAWIVPTLNTVRVHGRGGD
jgi:predicted MFS family arabinose efflux permease